MTKEEWISKFEKSVGVEFALQDNEVFVFNEDKGFTSYILKPEEETIIIPKMIGDGRYWCEGYSKMFKSIKDIGIDKLFFTTYRNPRAFCRLIGGVIQSHVVKEDGRVLYNIVSTPRMTDEALSRRRK